MHIQLEKTACKRIRRVALEMISKLALTLGKFKGNNLEQSQVLSWSFLPWRKNLGGKIWICVTIQAQLSSCSSGACESKQISLAFCIFSLATAYNLLYKHYLPTHWTVRCKPTTHKVEGVNWKLVSKPYPVKSPHFSIKKSWLRFGWGGEGARVGVG